MLEYFRKIPENYANNIAIFSPDVVFKFTNLPSIYIL